MLLWPRFEPLIVLIPCILPSAAAVVPVPSPFPNLPPPVWYCAGHRPSVCQYLWHFPAQKEENSRSEIARYHADVAYQAQNTSWYGLVCQVAFSVCLSTFDDNTLDNSRLFLDFKQFASREVSLFYRLFEIIKHKNMVDLLHRVNSICLLIFHFCLFVSICICTKLSHCIACNKQSCIQAHPNISYMMYSSMSNSFSISLSKSYVNYPNFRQKSRRT